MTKKIDLLKFIRRKCIDCCCGQVAEVRLCPVQTCELWPFRLGTDPNPSERGFAKNPSSRREISENTPALDNDISPPNEEGNE